ncbi:hypothetical protein M758_UG081800 [Ceratodon purpureus]|nr:hypothetical protein M758_UG081800 [Ceratodon purpureus]
MSSGLGMDTILVPVAKDESRNQSQNTLEDLFADVEFQASFPPISATARIMSWSRTISKLRMRSIRFPNPTLRISPQKMSFNLLAKRYPRPTTRALMTGNHSTVLILPLHPSTRRRNQLLRK